MRALARELHSTPPAGLSSLDHDQLQELAKSVADARHRQAAALAAAAEKSLGHIPWILRGPVRKVFGA